MRFNGRSGSPADRGDLDIGSQGGCVAPARAAGAALTRSLVPGERSERPCASGTRPGTQRKNREARSTRVALGPRKSGLPDLRRLTADLGQARDRSRCARPGHESGTRAKSRLAHEPLAVAAFTMSNSVRFFVPAARCCARVGLYSFAPDPKRGGRSADRRTISFVAFARRDRSAQVRRGASHDAGRAPLGAPPWRFSAGGRASISAISCGSVQRAPRSQVVVPGGRGPHSALRHA
jgi:hypothetical protein